MKLQRSGKSEVWSFFSAYRQCLRGRSALLPNLLFFWWWGRSVPLAADRPHLIYPFGGKPPKAWQPLLWSVDHWPTNDQLATEELKYSHDRAWWHLPPTNNMFKVWQNLAPFGGRPICSAVEALLTKVVNQWYWQSLIVNFFVAVTVSIMLRVSYSQHCTLRVWYSQRHLCNHNPLKKS